MVVIQLNQLRNQAFGKLKTEREKFSAYEMQQILDLITERHLFGEELSELEKQILKDVRLYKKYDCLAMWLDPESGLAHWEPELIIKIATEVGGLKVE